MAWRYHGRARVNPSNPNAFGVCDRCGLLYNLRSLRWQFQWAGNRLTNLRLLVCDICMDVPQQQLRPVIVPPDPVPVMNARPEPYSTNDNPDFRITIDGGIRVTEDDDERVLMETGDLMLYTMTHPPTPVPPPSPYPENAYTTENGTDVYIASDGSAFYVQE